MELKLVEQLLEKYFQGETTIAEEKQLKEELFNLRFQLATGQLENTARIKEVRKSIARIKTVLREQVK